MADIADESLLTSASVPSKGQRRFLFHPILPWSRSPKRSRRLMRPVRKSRCRPRRNQTSRAKRGSDRKAKANPSRSKLSKSQLPRKTLMPLSVYGGPCRGTSNNSSSGAGAATAASSAACFVPAYPGNRLRSEGKSKSQIKAATQELKAGTPVGTASEVLVPHTFCTGHKLVSGTTRSCQQVEVKKFEEQQKEEMGSSLAAAGTFINR